MCKMSYDFETLNSVSDDIILEGLLGRIVAKKITTEEEEDKKIVFKL